MYASSTEQRRAPARNDDPLAIEAAETIVLQASVADRNMQNPVLRAETRGGRIATLVRLRTASGLTGECYTLALGVETKALVDAIDKVCQTIVGRSRVGARGALGRDVRAHAARVSCPRHVHARDCLRR